MKFKNDFGSYSLLLSTLLVACGGTAIDGSAGDGDGDYSGDGDGDYSGDGDTSVGGGLWSGGTSMGASPGVGGDPGIGGYPGTGGYPSMGGYPGVGGGIGGYPGSGGSAYMPGPLVDCQVVDEYSQDNFCQVNQQCDNGWVNTYCENYDGRTICSCENTGSYIQVEMDGLKEGESCRQLSPICQNFPTLAPDVPEECTPTYSESGQGYCSLSEECRRTFVVDDIKLSSLSSHSAWCETGSCYCDQGARIEVPSGSTSAATCSSALDLCGTSAVAPTGKGVCAPTYQSATQDYCEVQLACSHTATLGSETVNVFNSGYANCSRSGDGVYTCSCQNNADPFILKSKSGWDACSELTKLCSF